MRYSGTAMETVDALGVDHPVERGEVLKASDLTIIKRPKSEGAVLTDAASAAGLAARHQLRPGQPLHDADLMKPQLVQRNDSVTIVYEAPGVSLTLRGQAQDYGALGDTISVQNVQSKRLVQGVVTGPGRVTITGDAGACRRHRTAAYPRTSTLRSTATRAQRRVSRVR